jgi:hypothetical protein
MRWGKYLIVLLTVTVLSSCSPAQIFEAVTSGGPKVNANAAIGREVDQAVNVGLTDNVKGNQINNQETVKADSVETVVVNQIGLLYFLIAIAGWVLPTPSQMGNSILNLFRRKNNE